MTVRRAIIGMLIAVTVLALPAQFLIDPSAENTACVCIAVASSLSVLLYIGWTQALETQPLSTFAILGFCATTQIGAVLVQTVAWTPVSKSLYAPVYTFGTLAFYQGIALLAHAAYRFFSVPRPTHTGVFRGLLGWAGLYRTPPSATLWFMGCIGLTSFFFTRQEGSLAKFGMAFNFLTWTPFLIPFYLREVGESYCNGRRNRLLLVGYIMVVGVFGMALNARTIVFVGVLTIGLLYLLAGMRSNARVTRRSLAGIGALVVVLAAVYKPLSDLTTSMVIAREWRGKLSPIEMIETTYSVWRRPGLIAAFKVASAARSRYTAYDEHYIDNPGLARFVTTKYHDNMLHFAAAITTDEGKAMLRDISLKFMWSAVPSPVLNYLGTGVDKEILNASIGDYMAYLGGGIRLGSHIVGSIFAHGIALFGPLFPFIYAAICLGLFGLMDLLTTRSEAGVAAVSALGMLEIWNYFSGGLTYDGLQGPFYFFVRNFWQTVLIYALVFGLARLAVRAKRALLGAPSAPTWEQHSA